MKPNVLESIIESKTLEFDAFTSTSKAFDKAKGFADPSTYANNSIIFEIESKSGVDIEDLSRYKKEKEVLFHKSKFKVGGYEFVEDKGYYLVKLKEMS